MKTDPFGSQLRDARERAGVSLRQIADVTRLPLTALKALEEGRIDQLPGGIYRRAIVRSFAREVGLDPETTLKAFLERYPDSTSTSVPLAATKPAVPSALRALLGLAGTLLPLLAGLVYFATGKADSAPLNQLRTLAAPLVSDERRPEPVDDALAFIVAVSSPARVAVIADGREVVARAMDAGEVVRLTAARDVVLMSDNAAALQFSINGRPGRLLGEPGHPVSAHISRSEYQSWLIQQ